MRLGKSSFNIGFLHFATPMHNEVSSKVRLLSDFCYNDIPFALPTEASKAALGADEYNLLYVALTRL